MIIDLTAIFNFLHHMWDVIGAGLLSIVCLFLPIAVVTASVIKVLEYKKSRLEKGE